MVSLTGIPIEPMVPGSPLWLSKMSASKVAAVLGLSPYDSRFSLWHRMAGNVPHDPDGATPELRRGHYLEPAIAHWFADQHPNAVVQPGGAWQHPECDWYTASPDRLISVPGTELLEGVECKTEADGDGWGDELTDQVPVEVRAQTMSQMDVVGTRRTYVAVLLPFLEFRQYVIEFDQAEADLIRFECEQFMAELQAGILPNLDAHAATLQTVRQLHPDIDRLSDVELTPELYLDYTTACADEKAAKDAKRLATAQILDFMGNARRALWLGEPVAIRVAVGDAVPFLRPAKAKSALEASR